MVYFKQSVALPSILGTMVMMAIIALATHQASGQVTIKLNNDPAPTTPGTKYPTIEACNQTSSPQLLEGWKFRTTNFTGYNQAWAGTLSKVPGPPVEYTQILDPNQGVQIQTGVCRSAPVDYSGTVPAGQDGTLRDAQALVKTGSCSEQPTYKDADPLICTEIKTDPTQYTNTCVVDSLGINGGDNFGGLVSTFNGQTQILQALPSTYTLVNGMNIKWDPRSLGGPQYMMSLAMGQELLNVDMQFIAAIAGKETLFGYVEQGREAQGSISEWANFNIDNDHVYSPWEIENTTFARTMQSYPQFYPKYGPCMGKYRDVTSATACSGDNGAWDAAGLFYMHTPGSKGTGPNSPQLANSILSTSLVWYWLYDALVQSTDLCFVDAITNGKDTRLALAALIPGYNLGPNSGFEAPLEKSVNIKNDPQGSLRFSPGNGDYRTNVFKIIDHLVDASKKSTLCGGTNAIYDADINAAEMQRFFFGGSVTPGTPALQGDGGLLLHFDLTLEQRQALLLDLTCAFDKLKGKAPSTVGKEAVSYRYDWLSLLRIAKTYLPSRRRLIPVQSDFRLFVDLHNKKTETCTGKILDHTYPALTITSPAQNATVSPSDKPGAKFTFTGSDNVAVAKAEWTFDKSWVAWNPATKVSVNNYEFILDCNRPDYPKKNTAAALWIRTTDDCGNSTVQQLDFRTHSVALCGDPPLPPQVATPVASPKGGDFSALSPGVSVTLTIATPSAGILYTTDGSEPDSVVGGATKQYAGVLVITTTTTLKARGVMDGMSASTVMTEVYTRVQPGKVGTPTANLKGKSFLGTLSVILLSSTPSTTIWYTLDGSIPDSAGGGTAKRLTAPILLTGNTTLTAIAVKEGMYKSDVMVETYTSIPPVTVKQAWYLDEEGDGRIEKAIVDFSSALLFVPTKLAFTIVDEGGNSLVRTANGTEISLVPGFATRATVTFADPFPQGITSLKNSPTSGQTFSQDAIPLNAGTFAVADSVAPIIVSAEVKEPGDGGILKRVLIAYSEAVNIGAGGQPLIFKREKTEMLGSAVSLTLHEKLTDRNYAFHVDSNSSTFPIVGDSVAITLNGQTADLFLQSPKFKLFHVLNGLPPKPKPVSLLVTFPNGSAMHPASGNSASNRLDLVFIPVDKEGNALASKCANCVARDNRGFVGPVFHILTPGPVEYIFKIFNTMGEFVAEGAGKVELADLDFLKKSNSASGIQYEAPIVWTGAARIGSKAATGAYILKATFITPKDLTTGALPGRFTEKKVFGMLRGCCGS